jgi:hypothetical protein
VVAVSFLVANMMVMNNSSSMQGERAIIVTAGRDNKRTQ